MDSIQIQLPSICPNDISIFQIFFKLDRPLDAIDLSILSAPERARTCAFHRNDDAVRFATMRIALRRQLSLRIGVVPEELPLFLDGTGRPALNGAWELDFNVSHSGARGLIALSDRRRVGVDIELRRRTFDWRDIASIALNQDERSYIASLDPEAQIVAFYTIWTAKESVLKAEGIGVATDLSCIGMLQLRDDLLSFKANTIPTLEAYRAVRVGEVGDYSSHVAWSTNSFKKMGSVEHSAVSF